MHAPLRLGAAHRNPARRMIAYERGSTGSLSYGTSESVNFKREDTHDEETRTGPGGTDSSLEETDHSDRVVAPAGGPDRGAELGRAVGLSRGNSFRESEEQCWTPAASSCAGGGVAPQGHQRPHLPSGRRPHSILRTGALPVWFDRNGMESGPQYPARLRGIARGRGGAPHQRVRGEVGVAGETDFLFLGGRGQDGTGGSHSLPKRDEVDGCLHVVGCGECIARREEAEGLRLCDQRQVPSSEGDREGISSLREDKDQGTETANHGAHDGACALCSEQTGKRARRSQAEDKRLQQGRVRSSAEDSRGDEPSASSDSVLAPHRLGGGKQNHQPNNVEALLHPPRQGGQVSGIRIELGHHALEGRLRPGSRCSEQTRAGRRPLRHPVGRRVPASFWAHPNCLCLRPSRSQQGEYRQATRARGSPYWTGPPRQDCMGGQRSNEASLGFRAHSSRRQHRYPQESALRLQPTTGSVRRHDGRLRSASGAWDESYEAGKGTG